MAKQPAGGAHQQPVPYPSNWSKLSGPEKRAWEHKNRGRPAPGQPAPAARAPAVAPAEAGAEQEQEEYVERPGQIDQGRAEQLVAEQIASEMGEMDLKRFVASILRNVADVLEAGAGQDNQEENQPT